MPATLEPTDPQLVALARHGGREAYGRLVARHQTLVVSLAYSVCGDFARSEDIAQEAFVAAWRQLGTLEEDAKFKSWVAGIARNLAHNAIRRRERRPDQPFTAVLETADEAPGPREQAVTRAESLLVWQTLEKLPETYREPLILFYRERQSVERVAEVLDLSTDAVKQRLTRGRAIMRNNVERVIERSLGFTTPGALFTTSVLGLLSVTGAQMMATGSAATVAKGVTAKGVASVSGLTFFGMLASPLLGVTVLAVGLLDSLRNFTQTRSERVFLKRLYGATGFFMLLCALGPVLLMWSRHAGSAEPRMTSAGILAWLALLALCAAGICLWARRPFIAWGRTVRLPANASPLRRRFWFGPDRALAYRSRIVVLGLPLLDIRFGHSPDDPLVRGTARGWIALGDVAHGVLFALGGVATGGVALGAIAVGFFSTGGIAVGAIASGGLAAGGAARGIVALGHTASGTLAAVGFDTAWGLIAVARHAAWGSVFAAADHVGDAVARSALQAAEPWRRSYTSSPVLLFLPSLLIPVLSAIGTNWLIRSRATGSAGASS